MGQFSQDGNLVPQFPFFGSINSNDVIRIMKKSLKSKLNCDDKEDCLSEVRIKVCRIE